MAIRITCIKTDNGDYENPNVAITHFGWASDIDGASGMNTRIEIYRWIKIKKGDAYLIDGSRHKIKVITAVTSSGTEYLKTEADTTEHHHLIHLPKC